MVLFQHLIDRHDVGMPQRHHHPRLAEKLLGRHVIVGVALAQHLDGPVTLRLAMQRPIDAGERSRPDHVQNLVVPVEIAVPLPVDNPIHLEIGQQFAADHQPRELVERHVTTAQLAPDRLELMGVDEVAVKCPLGEFFRR